MYKQDLALHNLQELVCYKKQSTNIDRVQTDELRLL